MPLVEHTLPEHLSSPPVLSGVRVTLSLVSGVCSVDRCFSFCTFSFGVEHILADPGSQIFIIFLTHMTHSLSFRYHADITIMVRVRVR